MPGTDGERFIIVLAGSEKIYVDGKLLQRGLEKDYTIDYNAGEVFFTPNQLITKDKRIIAEYEYSVQSYNRSIYTGEIDYKAKGYGLHFNAYSEQRWYPLGRLAKPIYGRQAISCRTRRQY